MQKHQIQVSQEDIERVDTLRYMWDKLRELMAQLQTTLLKIQPQLRSTLTENVGTYQVQVTTYTRDYSKVSIVHSVTSR